VIDHLLRQAGRHADPAIRQQVDEQAFAGRHGVDGDLALERQAYPGSIGIAPGDAHIGGSAGSDAINRKLGRLLEADDDDTVGEPDIGFIFFREGEDQAGVTPIGTHTDVALHHLGTGGAGKSGENGKEQRHLQQEKNHDGTHADPRQKAGIGTLTHRLEGE
jgi:hypothetical protein